MRHMLQENRRNHGILEPGDPEIVRRLEVSRRVAEDISLGSSMRVEKRLGIWHP